jgi:hypothetical protein
MQHRQAVAHALLAAVVTQGMSSKLHMQAAKAVLC